MFEKWATTWQNQQSDHAPSEDSDQPGHPPSLIRVFAVRSIGSWGPKLSSCGQRRLRWTHTHFVGFVMSWLRCGSSTKKNCILVKKWYLNKPVTQKCDCNGFFLCLLASEIKRWDSGRERKACNRAGPVPEGSFRGAGYRTTERYAGRWVT